jgi:hypothetical protein
MFKFRRIEMPIGGIIKALTNPVNLMQLAMGPAGWASLAMKTIGSQIAMNLIQKLGQQLGLPPAVIDLAQAAFAQASGQPGLAQQNIKEAVQGFVGQLDLRPSEAGQLERQLNSAGNKSFDSLMDIVSDFTKKIAEEGNGGEGKAKGKGGKKSGESWLVAFARAMGTVLDSKAKDIKEKSDTIATMADSNVDRKDGKAGSKHTEKLASETQLLQAFTQEMNLISTAATNSLKTVGESLSQVARK